MISEQNLVTRLRALALTKLVLTERRDLVVVDERPGSPYDLIVRVRSNTPIYEPAFAVDVKGIQGKISRQQVHGWITKGPIIPVSDQIPWCLFAFDITSRHGSYFWLAEPRVSDDGKPTLSLASTQTVLLQELRPLDLEALDSIVHAVIEWSNAVEQQHLLQARAS